MDCNEAIHQIYHYLDGVLTDESRAAIARHLDFCPPCSGGFHFEVELRMLAPTQCWRSRTRALAGSPGERRPVNSPTSSSARAVTASKSAWREAAR